MKKMLIATLCLGLCFGFTAQANDRFIVVSGAAEKNLDPNFVTMTVEVWSKSSTAKQAQQLAAVQYKGVKKTFDDFKIKNEDIKTDNYALNPDYQYDEKSRQNKLTGYRVSQSLSVTLRKVEETGKFLDALVAEKKSNDSGVNVNSLTWDSDKRTQAETAALGDAVRAAKLKAEEIAKAAGVKIKNVSKISHGTSMSPGPQPMFRNFAMKAQAESMDTQVSAGQVKVQVEVTAEYEIN